MTSESSFEWDPNKADSNLRKHGIRFEVSVKVFVDPDRKTIPDLRFDYHEERFNVYGYIDDRLYAVVVARDLELTTLRIISARRANARERKRYGYREIHH